MLGVGSSITSIFRRISTYCKYSGHFHYYRDSLYFFFCNLFYSENLFL